MDRITISWSRVSLAAGLGAVGLVVALLAGSQSETLAAQGNFIGGGPVRLDSEDVRKARVRLEAGARSNWHSHSWGQLLLVEEGHGRVQIRNQPLRDWEVFLWTPR